MPEQDYRADNLSSFGSYLKHAWWNVFRNKDPVTQDIWQRPDEKREYVPGMVSYNYPDKRKFSAGIDKTVVAAVLSRIAIDVAQANVKHVRVDPNNMFREEMPSGLNNILTCEANKDQTGRAFLLDFVISMFDDGVAAAVPVDTTVDPNRNNSLEYITMRVGKPIQWEPDVVQLEVYNDRLGRREYVKMAKSAVAIVENPFYLVMNSPNSTVKRLTRKLALLDGIDDDIGSKKMDVIVQLPYVVKNQTKKEQAEERRKQLEDQLENSKLGVGYIDGTERVIQLNRPLENNLMPQIEFLTSMLYSQLGVTPEIMNGTASESVMTNYYRRTVDVILQAICDEFERKFLTKTARTQRQAIRFYRDPFSLTPTTSIADIADKFTRNEILSPNEIRGVVGFLPSNDEAADELRNRNINQSGGDSGGGGEGAEGTGGRVVDADGNVSLTDLLS